MVAEHIEALWQPLQDGNRCRRIDIAAACHAEIPVGTHRVCPPVSRVFAHNGFIVIITDAFDASPTTTALHVGENAMEIFFWGNVVA